MWPPWMDAFLISGYRLPENPVVGFYVGTAILAFFATVVGEFTLSLVYLANRRDVMQTGREMARMHNLSMEALRRGDRNAYQACNKNANDAFGRTFFMQIAMAAALLWPIPIALDWMGTRFSTVRFPLPLRLPLVGNSVGYPALFLLIYILVRIVFKRIRPKLPYFSWVYGKIRRDAQEIPELEPLPVPEGGKQPGKAKE